MVLDSQYFSAATIGAIINVVGLIIPLLVFLPVVLRRSSSFFTYWALNYLLTAFTILGDMIAGTAGYSTPISAFIFVCFTFASTFLALAARELLIGLKSVWIGAVAVLTLGAGLVALALGVPFLSAALPVLVFNVASYVTLGVALFRTLASPTSSSLHRVLGALVIFTGLWALAYPVLVPLKLLWLGYTVAGLNHLLAGMGMVIFTLDTTQEELRIANRELVSLNALKSEFLAIAGHELRTPLSIIKGGTWVLRNTPLDPASDTYQALLTGIATHADNLNELVENLLNLSQGESGTLNYRFETFDLSGLLDEIVRGFAGHFASNQVDLVLVTPGETLVTADRLRLKQVMTNLLWNAAKFTPGGGIVQVTLSREEGAVLIAVADTGIGIAEEQRERVFETFYQVDSSPTRAQGGLGLGLALCKTIVVDGHTGRIWADENPAGGCTFRVSLPPRG